jgi:hypothetical protein
MKTDWLASDSVFYNIKTNKISKNINDVIDFESFDWHPEGLYNFLDFGYSVLEQTPLKNVKFLRHSSEIIKENNGKLEINYSEDEAEKWIGNTSNENDILHLIEKKVRTWENSVSGKIILPTSGGYDSRLLNLMIDDKSRIQSFTYGLSSQQSKSVEVVHAKKIAEILGTEWQQIQLGNYHKYFDEWYKNYGIATHAHGMYHIEFYEKMNAYTEGGNPFLSGIIGDAWAGSVKIEPIKSIQTLTNLGYSHGLKANPEKCLIHPNKFELREAYLSINHEKFEENNWKVTESMRFKIILLNYLINIPSTFGYKPYSPFLDIDVALGMLTLPEERKKNRIWQQDFFKRHNLLLENLKLKSSWQNNLNYQASLKQRLNPLSVELLSEIIKPEYVQWVNKHTLQSKKEVYKSRLHQTLKSKRGLWRIAPKNNFDLSAYTAYLTLYPLQKIIQQRNEHFSHK